MRRYHGWRQANGSVQACDALIHAGTAVVLIRRRVGNARIFPSKDASVLAEPTIPSSNPWRLPVVARRAFVLTSALALGAAVVWVALIFGTRVVGLEAADSRGTSMEPVLHQGDSL